MVSIKEIKVEDFEKMLKEKLGDLYGHALKIFNNYGSNLAFDVTNVILLASDQGKVEKVFSILEKHYQKYIQHQHPEIRGHVKHHGINLTSEMFLAICRNILELKPNP